MAAEDDDLILSGDRRIPAAELSYAASRSSGPGGQHVNKTSTRISVRWNARTSQALPEADRARLLEALASRLTQAGELVVSVEDYRSQARNRALARERLATLIEEATHVDAPRRPTRPSKASRRRRLESKRQRSTTKARRRPPHVDRDE